MLRSRTQVSEQSNSLDCRCWHKAERFGTAAIPSALGGPTDALSGCRRREKVTHNGPLESVVLPEGADIVRHPRALSARCRCSPWDAHALGALRGFTRSYRPGSYGTYRTQKSSLSAHGRVCPDEVGCRNMCGWNAPGSSGRQEPAYDTSCWNGLMSQLRGLMGLTLGARNLHIPIALSVLVVLAGYYAGSIVGI